jgi:bacillithiol system protein YtxJ
MASDPFRPLTSTDELQAALKHAQDEPIVLYKHSAICPISARMQKEVAALTEPDDPPVYRVVVQEARDVSDAIEERLGVRHESPQALLVYQDTVPHDASHSRISADDLRTAATQTAHD